MSLAVIVVAGMAVAAYFYVFYGKRVHSFRSFVRSSIRLMLQSLCLWSIVYVVDSHELQTLQWKVV